MSTTGLPRFLRFTRALALVSGIVAPAAIVACGGSVDSEHDGQEAADSGYDGRTMGTLPQPYDGGPMGSRVCDEGCGIQAIDSGYDGTVFGVAPMTEAGSPDAVGGGIGLPPDASADDALAGGGPLSPPELFA